MMVPFAGKQRFGFGQALRGADIAPAAAMDQPIGPAPGNGSATCPDNTAAAGAQYVERAREVSVTD